MFMHLFDSAGVEPPSEVQMMNLVILSFFINRMTKHRLLTCEINRVDV